MSDVQIKDIYAGKPDAKDEVETVGLDSFIDSFILPISVDLNSLINDAFCFIVGYKGTGKTALLYYLDCETKKKDNSTCSSFIFFKEDYTDIKKQEMEFLSKRLKSSISIGDDIILDGQDFEYIWRWLFYQRLYEDNTEYDHGIFANDENWDAFQREIKKIGFNGDRRKLSIPKKLKLSMPITDVNSTAKISPELELDFSSDQSTNSRAYRIFVSVIEELDSIFPNLQKTDIPYYIFVDELEAYYGDEVVFFRDLRLIRDLIFTVMSAEQTKKPTNTRLSSPNLV